MMIQTLVFFTFVIFVTGTTDTSDTYFTLVQKNGEKMTGDMTDFNELLRKLNPELEQLPEYGKILEEGYAKMNDEMESLMVGGDEAKEAVLLSVSNNLADMYENIFAAAGMELKIHNRKPYIFTP